MSEGTQGEDNISNIRRGTHEEDNDYDNVWTRAEAAADACASPAWACRTSEVEACLAREAVLPVRLARPTSTDDESDARTVALPLWLAAALARASASEHLHLSVTLDDRGGNTGAGGAGGTLAVYSSRALGMLRADPHALALGPLPAYYAVGAAVAAAAHTPARTETLRDAAAARLERIGVAASSMDAADVAAFAQLLARPERTYLDAVRADTVALDDWRALRPLRIAPSAYVSAARDASVTVSNDPKRPRLI